VEKGFNLHFSQFLPHVEEKNSNLEAYCVCPSLPSLCC
jgi:hypothetical protein